MAEVEQLLWAYAKEVPLGKGVGGLVQFPSVKSGGVETQEIYLNSTGDITTDFGTITGGDWGHWTINPNTHQEVYTTATIIRSSVGAAFSTLDVDHPANGVIYMAAAHDRWIMFGQYAYMLDLTPYLTSFDYTETSDSKVSQFSSSLQNIGPDIYGEESGLFNPGAKILFNARVGDSAPYQMGVMWLDEIGYSLTDEEVSMSGRNAIGYFLKDQSFDQFNYFSSSIYAEGYYYTNDDVNFTGPYATEAEAEAAMPVGYHVIHKNEERTEIQGPSGIIHVATPRSTDKFNYILGSVAQQGWANVFPYSVQSMTATREWKFEPETTILEGLEEMFSAWSAKSGTWVDGVYRMHKLDICENNRGVVLIGFDEFIEDYGLKKGHYQFDLGTEVFSRNTRRNVDAAYTHLYITGKKPQSIIDSEKEAATDESTVSEYWNPIVVDLQTNDYWSLGPRRTKHLEAPEGLTHDPTAEHDEFAEWAQDRAYEYKKLGITEEFTGPLRPQITPGDIAEIVSEGYGLDAGIITEVRHSFSKQDGFRTSFTVSSGGQEGETSTTNNTNTSSPKASGYDRNQNTVDVIRAMVGNGTTRKTTASGSNASFGGSNATYINGEAVASGYILPQATASKLGGVKAISRDSGIHVKQVAIDTNGQLWSEDESGSELPVVTISDEGKVLKVNDQGEWDIGDDENTTYGRATNTMLGLVKAPDKTDQNEKVGIDSDGYLWSKDTTYDKANSTTLGLVKAADKQASDIQHVRIDNDGFLWAEELMATSSTLGGIKADTKDNDHRQPVAIDTSTGKLWAKEIIADANNLGGIKADSATADQTESVGIDATGFLKTKPKNERILIDINALGLTDSLTRSTAWAGSELDGTMFTGYISYPNNSCPFYDKFVHSDTISVFVSSPVTPLSPNNDLPTFEVEVSPVTNDSGYINKRGSGWDAWHESTGLWPKYYLDSAIHYLPMFGRMGAFVLSLQIKVVLKSNGLEVAIYIWNDHTGASSTHWGLVKPADKTAAMTLPVGINSSGELYTTPYSLPMADSTNLGGVMPVAKTSAMTQDVGVDSNGRLYTEPGSGGSLSAITIEVTADFTGVTGTDRGSYTDYPMITLTPTQQYSRTDLIDIFQEYVDGTSDVYLQVNFPSSVPSEFASLAGYGNLKLKLDSVTDAGTDLSAGVASFDEAIGSWAYGGPYILSANVSWTSSAIAGLYLDISIFNDDSGTSNVFVVDGTAPNFNPASIDFTQYHAGDVIVVIGNMSV